MKFIIPLFLFSLACTHVSNHPSKKASIIIKNVTLFNGYMKRDGTSVAIVNDTISHVDTWSAIKHLVDKNTTVIAGENLFLAPGFIESHGHMMSLGKQKLIVDLHNTTSFAEVIELVAQETKRKTPGTWIIGRGWDQNRWQEKNFPHHHALSALSPHHPVYLTRVDGHAAIVNQAAMQLIKLQSHKHVEGGIIVRHNNTPTGVLIDNAMELAKRHIPALSKNDKMNALMLGMKEAVGYGITTFTDAGIDEETFELYKELIDHNKMPLRMYAMASYEDKDFTQKLLSNGPQNYKQKLFVRCIKVMADGALGSRGAALLEAYSDDLHNKGLFTVKADELETLAHNALKAHVQVATHAIGDAANRMVLNSYATALKQVPRSDHRFRIEHAQVIHENDIPRFASLNVIPSMQATHCTSDSPWAGDRLGANRYKHRAYMWQELIKSGALIAGGSDAPVESVNPLLGIYAATTRQNLEGFPKYGWNATQKMTMLQALQSYTTWAAHAAFLENDVGSIAVGKKADLVLLNKNPFSSTRKELLDTKVMITIANGEIAYKRQLIQP